MGGAVETNMTVVGQNRDQAALEAPVGNALGSRDTRLQRTLVLFSVWAAFLTGALLAAFLLQSTISWVLLAPPVLLLFTLAVANGESDGDSARTRPVTSD